MLGRDTRKFMPKRSRSREKGLPEVLRQGAKGACEAKSMLPQLRKRGVIRRQGVNQAVHGAASQAGRCRHPGRFLAEHVAS